MYAYCVQIINNYGFIRGTVHYHTILMSHDCYFYTYQLFIYNFILYIYIYIHTYIYIYILEF